VEEKGIQPSSEVFEDREEREKLKMQLEENGRKNPI